MMSKSPAKKAAVPFAFCFRAKKSSVFCGPIMIVRPMRKRIYLRGRRGLEARPISQVLDFRGFKEVACVYADEGNSSLGTFALTRQHVIAGEKRTLPIANL